MQDGPVEVRQQNEPIVCLPFCAQIVEERLRANELVHEDFSIRWDYGRYTGPQRDGRDSQQIRANPIECRTIPWIHLEPSDCESLRFLGDPRRQMIDGPIILM